MKIGDLQLRQSIGGNEKIPCAYEDGEETWALTPNGLRAFVGTGDGGSSGALTTFDALAPIDGEQTFALSSPYSGGWSRLCVNGLRQLGSLYSVSESVLTLLAGLNVVTGDYISFDYTP